METLQGSLTWSSCNIKSQVCQAKETVQLYLQVTHQQGSHKLNVANGNGKLPNIYGVFLKKYRNRYIVYLQDWTVNIPF